LIPIAVAINKGGTGKTTITKSVEGIFGTIKYFSLMGQDGEVLVNVLQKQADNPIQGAIPMLKVASVDDWIANSDQWAARL
jgi:hypothetical protein